MTRRSIRIIAGIVIITASLSSDTRSPRSKADTLQIADIFGLQQALNIRPTIGTGFTVGRAAVINDTGAIDGAEGNLSDCVLVDGSSAPCGSSIPVLTTQIDGETPMGVIDGTNASFALANVPNPAASLHVYLNGLRLTQPGDYTLNGGVITFVGTQIPNPSDGILADYRY